MEVKLDDVKDSYTASVLAFSLKLAGSAKANDLLKNLDKQAVRQGKNKVTTKKHIQLVLIVEPYFSFLFIIIFRKLKHISGWWYR